MRALIIMCIGVIIGRLIFPAVLKKSNEKLQVAVTALLIFTMGITLGGNGSLLQNMASMGFDSLLFCLIPTALSVAIVYLITKNLFPREEENSTEEA